MTRISCFHELRRPAVAGSHPLVSSQYWDKPIVPFWFIIFTGAVRYSFLYWCSLSLASPHTFQIFRIMLRQNLIVILKSIEMSDCSFRYVVLYFRQEKYFLCEKVHSWNHTCSVMTVLGTVISCTTVILHDCWTRIAITILRHDHYPVIITVNHTWKPTAFLVVAWVCSTSSFQSSVFIYHQLAPYQLSLL